ncbi:amino acid kinase [archaeon SCG-AAA382B04]|nr:amino acid kinase [archaeon SCG-AAA382B04]
MKALKIGGSVITDKFKYKQPDESQIKRISEELRSKYKNLILIHGAGSFGHPLVEKNNLKNQIKTPKQFIETSKVQESVKELNKIFVKKIRSQEIPFITIHPSSCAITKNGEIKKFPTKTIKQALKKEVLPILHGDMVLDEEKGAKVLSGDKIITYLAEKLNAEKIGMGARSPVLDKNGKPLNKIQKTDLEALKGAKSTDVTGGMKRKVEELLKTKKESFIFNATKKGNIEKFLNNQKIGTEVLHK